MAERSRTGIDLIDSEHAYLINLLGRLEEICVKSRCNDCDATQIAQSGSTLIVLFSEFLDFMLKHFRDEEDFMRTIGMPKNLRERHVEEHANISQRIQELIDRNLDNVVVKPANFHLAISAILEDHIENWDVSIASHLGLCPLAAGGS
jgi:hemerythrin-like metal-binding protein